MTLRQEMIDSLSRSFGREIDMFDVEAAIYWFGYDYHQGQSSELYSILSTSDYRPGRMVNSVEDESETVIEYYNWLVECFA